MLRVGVFAQVHLWVSGKDSLVSFSLTNRGWGGGRRGGHISVNLGVLSMVDIGRTEV